MWVDESYVQDLARRVVEELGISKAAREFDVSVTFLYEVINGKKPPGRKISERLGFRRVVKYESINEKAEV